MQMQMRVSEHAVDKYIKLVREKYGLTLKSREQCIMSILEVFLQSEKEELHGGLVKRIIDNGFEDSNYYRYNNWRLVVTDGCIVTIEEAFLKKQDGLDAQTNYKHKRYIDYVTKQQRKKECYERRKARKAKSVS